MKKILLTAIFLILPLLAQAQAQPSWVVPQNYNFNNPGSVTQTAQPQQTTVAANGQINYTPLEPLSSGSAFNYGSATPLQDYLRQGYTILVTVGSLLAVVFLVVGGVRYMLSEAFTDKDKAKHQMWSAIWGLVIIIGSFLILYSINPNLLTFKLDLPGINQQASSFSPTTGGLPTGGSGGGNGNLINTSALTNDQYNKLDQALNPTGFVMATGAHTDASGAYPTTDPVNDPNVKVFEQQCESSAAGAIAAGALAAYFVSPTLAAGGLILAGAQPIRTVQPIPGEQVGLPANTTVEACVSTTFNN